MSDLTDNLTVIRDHLDAILAKTERLPTKAQWLGGSVLFAVAFLVAVVVFKRLI